MMIYLKIDNDFPPPSQMVYYYIVCRLTDEEKIRIAMNKRLQFFDKSIRAQIRLKLLALINQKVASFLLYTFAVANYQHCDCLTMVQFTPPSSEFVYRLDTTELLVYLKRTYGIELSEQVLLNQMTFDHSDGCSVIQDFLTQARAL